MRVLHVIPSYIPAYRYGGPIYSVHGLCKSLAKLGHDVSVFTTNVDGNNDSDVPLGQPVDIDGVKVWYFPSKRLRRLYWSPPMKKALEKHIPKIDILHLHSIFLWPTWVAARLARRVGKPYIIAPRGMLVKELIRRKSRSAKNLWISLIERRNLEHAAALHVTTGNEMKEAGQFGFNLPPVFVVPNGVDILEEIRRKPQRLGPVIENIIQNPPFILFLGRINWKKGLDRLIPALAYVPDIPLVIAGNDEENYKPEIEALATSHGVSERIAFTGPVYGDDKAALLKNASVLVLPSYSENFGNVVLEAMAVRCPIVVTPEVGLSDTVRETGSGIVVQGEAAQLGNGIKNLLSNPDLIERMGENGQKAVKERFRWAVVAEQMERVYQNILDVHIKG
jgi:glycosyltransferase involved in cell wall biosynthesis